MYEVYDVLTGETVARARNNLRAMALCDEISETSSWIGRKTTFDVRFAQ